MLFASIPEKGKIGTTLPKSFTGQHHTSGGALFQATGRDFAGHRNLDAFHTDGSSHIPVSAVQPFHSLHATTQQKRCASVTSISLGKNRSHLTQKCTTVYLKALTVVLPCSEVSRFNKSFQLYKIQMPTSVSVGRKTVYIPSAFQHLTFVL